MMYNIPIISINSGMLHTVRRSACLHREGVPNCLIAVIGSSIVVLCGGLVAYGLSINWGPVAADI